MSRMQSVITFRPFHCQTEDDQLDFADYIQAQFDLLPRKVSSKFQCIEINENGDMQLRDNINELLRLCLATRGIPRHINDLFVEVIEQTTADVTVNKQHFADAWDSVLKSSYGVDKNPPNPFLADIQSVKRHLIKLELYLQSKETN